MKIWKSFSCEHSDKLRITGKFKTIEDAKSAENAFNDLLQIHNRQEDKTQITKELRAMMDKHDVYLNPGAENDFDFLYAIKANGKQIVVETDDFAVGALSQVFIRFGAKVEIYSRHDYE